MKKFLAMMLAVLMLLSMATVAFADGDKVSATITFKNVVGAGAPETTYTFTFNHGTNGSGENYRIDGPLPANNVVTVTMGGNTAGQDVSFTLGDFTATGIYLYSVTRTFTPFKGGVDTEASQTYKFLVNVFYEGTTLKSTIARMWEDTIPADPDDKKDRFTTTYQAGRLTVQKKVESFFDADKDNYGQGYEFTAGLLNVNSGVTYTGVIYDKNNTAKSDTVTFVGQNDSTATATFKLNDGDYLVIENLPYGTTYSVTETNPEMSLGARNNHRVDQVIGEVTYTDNASKQIGNETADVVEVKNAFNYNGDLVIKKIVGGNFGDKEYDTFTFTVTIDGNYTPETTGGATCTSSGNGVYTLTMKHGASVTFKNVPYGTDYTVKETTPYSSVSNALKEYKKDATDATNTKNSAEGKGDECSDKVDFATEEVTFTNTNEQPIETGVSLDTLPYVLVLALAGAGLVMMIARKRRVQD